MNPFANAKLLGKSADEVVSFLSQWNPKLADKIKQALALGYSADEVMNFLGQGFDSSNPKKDRNAVPQYERALRIMGERKPEAVKQARAERERDVLSDLLDPNRMLAAAGGAGAGFLAGGPVGAVAGGLGGLSGYGDLLKRYQQHVEQGGSLSLSDWLKSIMKGVGTGAAASQAPRLLAAIQAGGLGGEEQPQTVEEVAEEIKAPAAPPEAAGVGPEESFKILQAKGAGNVFESIAGQVESAGQMHLALQKLYGKQWLKDIETEHKRPASEIIEQAWEFVKAKQPVSEKAPPTQDIQAQAAAEMPVEQPDVKPLYTGKGHPELQKYIASIGKIDTGPRKNLSKDAKELRALKSSNVRYADYDPEEQKLQVLFAPSGAKKAGEIYEYFDVPREDVEEMMKGSGTAVTTGANQFRAWFGGKNPSIGRAFHDFIKKKDAAGDAVYPYRKISEKYVKDEDLLKVRGADTVFKTTQYVEAFEDLVLKSQAKTRAEGLKIASEALKDLPDNMLEQMIFEVTKNVSGEMKEARAKGKQKRFKGGKEKEIRRRIEERAAAEKRKGGG